MEKVNFRAHVLTRHLNLVDPSLDDSLILQSSPCISYSPPELSQPAAAFDEFEMRRLMGGHHLEDRDWLYGLMVQSKLLNPRSRGGKDYICPDYNQSMEQQRDITMKRIEYLSDCGLFRGWLTEKGPESELRKLAFLDVVAIFDHSLGIKIGVHFLLWYGHFLKIFSLQKC